jgi:hypothetical protein
VSTSLVLFCALGAFVVFAALGFVALKLLSAAKRTTVAGVTLTRPGAFSLAVPAVTGPAEMWIRYAVDFPFERPFGAQTSRTFCLVLDLVVDGERMRFGHGGRTPPDLLEFEGLAQYMTKFSPGTPTTNTSYKATVLVKRLPSCPRLVEGTLYDGNGTRLVHAQLTIRA